MTVRVLLLGVLGGFAAAGVLILLDALTAGAGLFGMRSGMYGIAAGGLLLVLGFLMSVMSYVLASRNLAPDLRKRLLAAAVFAGAAGMVCGLVTTVVWLAAGGVHSAFESVRYSFGLVD